MNKVRWWIPVSSLQLCKKFLIKQDGIRSWYKHESCSLGCQEQVEMASLPWMWILIPEINQEQGCTESCSKWCNLLDSWPNLLKPTSTAFKWWNASNGGGLMVWNRLELRQDFWLVTANRGDELGGFESELVQNWGTELMFRWFWRCMQVLRARGGVMKTLELDLQSRLWPQNYGKRVRIRLWFKFEHVEYGL
jgi:hypothetical protein